MTAAEFIADAEKKGLQLHAIIKEVPVGSGRKLLFGFEHSKRSRKYRHKYMLQSPIELNELHSGPIKKQPADTNASAGASRSTPTAPGGQ